jgi:CubicO group peptidase (beta-lactamase class C family)
MSSGTWEGNGDTTIWSPQQAAAIGTGAMNWVDLLATRKVSEAQTNLFGTKRKPGEEFGYGSTGPLVLGVMLNRSTGMTYAKWVEQQVLIPAGIATPCHHRSRQEPIRAGRRRRQDDDARLDSIRSLAQGEREGIGMLR